MSLQWYPGHMTKARRELAEVMPQQQLVIEVLDARLPRACRNPVIAELGPDKPRLFVLTKSDLADPVVTAAWVEHYQRATARAAAVAVSTDDAFQVRAQVTAGLRRLGLTLDPKKRVRALIAGVPNVGKSTLVNTLLGRVVAEVADKPAVTKVQKLVPLPSGLLLTDTPGILWPKIEDPASALALALAGSIPDTAIDYPTTASFGATLLLARYPALVCARYRLGSPPASAAALLEEIGRRRGALRAGGVVDEHKAAEILVREVRSGALGRLSLESPR